MSPSQRIGKDLAIKENRYPRTVDSRAIAHLEVCGEAKGETSRGTDGVPGKQTAEVDDI